MNDDIFEEFHLEAHEHFKNNTSILEKIKNEILNKIKIKFKEKFCKNCEILDIYEPADFDYIINDNIKNFKIKFKKDNKIKVADIIIDFNKSEGKIIVDNNVININDLGRYHGK